jgi:DNA primase
MDKSHVDILTVAQSYIPLKKSSSYNGGQYSGACPVCGGKDRFQVWVGKQTCWCRQCGLSGDAIALVMKADNVDFRTACDKLGIRLDDAPQPNRTKIERKEPVPPHPLETLQPLDRTVPAFSKAWQEGAKRFIEQSHKRLMNDDRAMRYITEARRITSSEAVRARLGFNPRNRNERWGDVDVFLPRGIVIPWAGYRDASMSDYFVSRIRFRMLDKDYLPTTRNGKKYPQVAGACNGLFVCPNWTWDYPDVISQLVIVLVEGEFDALAFNSNINYGNITAWAVGGTSQARVKEWVDLLSKARKVLLAFDSGETAGPLASVWWSSVLPNSKRLKPIEHDITDMVTAGHDLDAWIKGAGVMRDDEFLHYRKAPKQSTSNNVDNNHYKLG